MLTWSHLAVGLIAAGTVCIVFGIVGALSSTKQALRRAKDAVKLRKALNEASDGDTRMSLQFPAGTEAEEMQRRTNERNVAWAGYLRIADAANVRLGTYNEIGDDPFSEESMINGLRRQTRGLVGDLVWVGTGTVLTAAGSLVSMI